MKLLLQGGEPCVHTKPRGAWIFECLRKELASSNDLLHSTQWWPVALPVAAAVAPAAPSRDWNCPAERPAAREAATAMAEPGLSTSSSSKRISPSSRSPSPLSPSSSSPSPSSSASRSMRVSSAGEAAPPSVSLAPLSLTSCAAVTTETEGHWRQARAFASLMDTLVLRTSTAAAEELPAATTDPPAPSSSTMDAVAIRPRAAALAALEPEPPSIAVVCVLPPSSP